MTIKPTSVVVLCCLVLVSVLATFVNNILGQFGYLSCHLLGEELLTRLTLLCSPCILTLLF